MHIAFCHVFSSSQKSTSMKFNCAQCDKLTSQINREITKFESFIIIINITYIDYYYILLYIGIKQIFFQTNILVIKYIDP